MCNGTLYSTPQTYALRLSWMPHLEVLTPFIGTAHFKNLSKISVFILNWLSKKFWPHWQASMSLKRSNYFMMLSALFCCFTWRKTGLNFSLPYEVFVIDKHVDEVVSCTHNSKEIGRLTKFNMTVVICIYSVDK